MIYKCIKPFSIPACDDDGFETDKEFIVTKDSIWELSESKWRICGGEVRLDNDNCEWIEISRELFESNFELMQVKMKLPDELINMRARNDHDD